MHWAAPGSGKGCVSGCVCVGEFDCLLHSFVSVSFREL